MDSAEEKVDGVMVRVLPEMNETIQQLADEQIRIREALTIEKTNSTWLKANLGYMLHIIEAVALIVVAAKIAH